MPPEDWSAHADLCQQALTDGDLTAAEAHLLRALAALTGPRPMKLWLREAQLAQALQDDARADAVLAAAEAAYPKNPWPPLRQAERALKRADTKQAQRCLDRARSVAPDPDALHFLVCMVEVALCAQDESRAGEALARLTSAHPDHPRLVSFWRQLAELLAGSATPLAALEDLRPLIGDHPALELARAQLYRHQDQPVAEDETLTAVAMAHPTHLAVLKYLFETQLPKAADETLAAVVDALEGRIPDALFADLKVQACLSCNQGDAALRAILARSRRSRSPVEANQRARALFGSARYRRAFRYLRAALLRWPQTPALISLGLHQSIKLGQHDLAREILAQAAPHLPEHTLQGFRLLLAAGTSDLQSALDAYAALDAGGGTTSGQLDIMAKMLFTLASPAELDSARGHIASLFPEKQERLHRAGLGGRMLLEMHIESRDSASHALPQDWLRARPQSTMAAIRLIDHWRAARYPVMPVPEGVAGAPVGKSVPRLIHQYWHAAEPPDAVRAMIASWQAAPGFEHRLMSRTQARLFLRRELGPRWARAFELARNPAEEADLLRLCLLARQGGIWADADDRLYGDLGGLLAGARGLWVYREPMGGALGNNFIGASPGHPAIVLAARMVRAALLERSADSAWFKTGPGPLTRAVGHFLLHGDMQPADRLGLHVLDGAALSRVVAMHNPTRYKGLPKHWVHHGARRRESRIWPGLLDRLQQPG